MDTSRQPSNFTWVKKASYVAFTAMAVACGTAASAQATPVTTLTFSGARWNDGGGLSGTFTVALDSSGTPITLQYANITTTAGSVVTTGYHYVYSASDSSLNTVSTEGVDATQPSFTANEIFLYSPNRAHNLYLDWTGEGNSAALYLGSSNGQYSSESLGFSETPIRALNASGGNTGTSVGSTTPVSTPEPASLALLATGVVGFGLLRRKRNV